MGGKQSIDVYQKAGRQSRPDGRMLLLCYDRILESAARHEPLGVQRGLDLLEESLNPRPNPRLHLYLAQLYAYVRQCVKSGRFDEASRVIEDLRNTWASAIAAEDGGELPVSPPSLPPAERPNA